MNSQNDFYHPEDCEYFDRLLAHSGGVVGNIHLFDFRDPNEKRAEFNRIRDSIFATLISLYGPACQLCFHTDCTGTASQVDHLIPLSSNVLNKELRGIKGVAGKKTPTQSFGSNHQDNFVLACPRCNAFKKHRFPSTELIEKIQESRRNTRTAEQCSACNE